MKPVVQQQQQQRLVRSRTQPFKLSGFGDIVKQAGAELKNDKTTISQTRAQTTSSTSVQATKTTTTTTITNAKAKNFEKWEEFRERKLAKMKQHKINVERRMQASYNNDSEMYWSQRADKLKRYPKHEALHPTWYTENIYSNQSIDLETDEFNCSNDKYGKYPDEMGYATTYGINGYGKRHHVKHMDSRYRYPKSQSCCFGSGYDERSKPILMPKSSSFGGSVNISYMHSSARSAVDQDMCIHPAALRPPKISANPNNIQAMYSSTHESESYMEVRRRNDAKNAVNRRGFRKFYCWENEHERNMMKENELFGSMVPHLEDDFYMKNGEIYQIEKDRDCFKKQNAMLHGGHGSSNANYIRNFWDNRHRDSVASAYKMNINEINGNYTEEYSDVGYDISDKSRSHELDNNHLPFESEEYLIVHKPRNSFGDSSSSYCHGNYSTDVDPYKPNERSECYLMSDKNNLDPSTSMDYSMNKNRYDGSHSMKSKCMLEVKPPNRYDDSSSDSTVDDLYDFNFDFINQFNDLDYRNNNNNCNGNGNGNGNGNNKNINSNKNLLFNDNLKTCNANYKENNYTKFRQNLDDRIDNDINDIDIEHESRGSDDDDIEIESITSTNNEYFLLNRSARDRYYDEYYIPMNNNHHFHHHSNVIGPNGNNQINNTINNTNKFINNNVVDDRPSNSHDASNGAISLINNIFSIYKPKKYSPLSCRSGVVTSTQKISTGISKSMNVPSTVRPLGAPYNDFLTSMKRPLTIAPSCFKTQKRTWSIPSSASVDQAHFKIIPEKTGLKISPLYRFGYEDDSKLRLKCTARPLLFPI